MSDVVKRIAGFDEVGRGPLAGPVVAACVFVDPDFKYKKEYIQINDSKKINEKKREKIFELIKREFRYIGVGICSPEEIDKLNILQASLLAMKKAYESIEISADYLLIDGNKKINDLDIPQKTIVKGDSSVLSIAAASIIAKVTRDRLMYDYDKIYPAYGFGKHKGYGTKQHLEAIKRFGICSIHRKSFKPCQH